MIGQALEHPLKSTCSNQRGPSSHNSVTAHHENRVAYEEHTVAYEDQVNAYIERELKRRRDQNVLDLERVRARASVVEQNLVETERCVEEARAELMQPAILERDRSE